MMMQPLLEGVRAGFHIRLYGIMFTIIWKPALTVLSHSQRKS